MKKVIAIVGPSGSGKTSLSIKIAKHFNSEIINCDSVQIYKELNIGSAKIKPHETEGIVHHLLSVATLDKQYSIYNFQHDARALIAQIKLPILVGGSGLYLKSALYDYQLTPLSNDDLSDIDYKILYQKLLELDPLVKVDANNPQRIISAYRQALAGNPRSLKTSGNKPLYDLCIIYLDLDRTTLKTRLINRLEQMIEDGFILEVEALLKNNHQLNIIGYREITQYLNGSISLDTAKEQIINATLKYAKRQKTWFKNQMAINIVDSLDVNLVTNVIEIITKFLQE